MLIFILLFMLLQSSSIEAVSEDLDDLEIIKSYEENTTVVIEQQKHLYDCIRYVTKKPEAREDLWHMFNLRNSFFGSLTDQVIKTSIENVLSKHYILALNYAMERKFAFCTTVWSTKNWFQFREKFEWIGDHLYPCVQSFRKEDFDSVMFYVADKLSVLVREKRLAELEEAASVVKQICSTASKVMLSSENHQTFEKLLAFHYRKAAFEFWEVFQITQKMDMMYPIQLCREITNIVPDEKKNRVHEFVIVSVVQRTVEQNQEAKRFMQSNMNNTFQNFQKYQTMLEMFYETANNSERIDVASRILDLCTNIVSEKLKRTSYSLYPPHDPVLNYLKKVECEKTFWSRSLSHNFQRTADSTIQHLEPICQSSYDVFCGKTDEWYNRSFANFDIYNKISRQASHQPEQFSYVELSLLLESEADSFYSDLLEKSEN